MGWYNAPNRSTDAWRGGGASAKRFLLKKTQREESGWGNYIQGTTPGRDSRGGAPELGQKEEQKGVIRPAQINEIRDGGVGRRSRERGCI